MSATAKRACCNGPRRQLFAQGAQGRRTQGEGAARTGEHCVAGGGVTSTNRPVGCARAVASEQHSTWAASRKSLVQLPGPRTLSPGCTVAAALLLWGTLPRTFQFFHHSRALARVPATMSGVLTGWWGPLLVCPPLSCGVAAFCCFCLALAGGGAGSERWVSSQGGWGLWIRLWS